MMSLATIRALSAEVAQEAAVEERRPFVPTKCDFAVWGAERKGINIPHFGDYVPDGWERRDEETWWFVDKSGFGADDEPALSLDQFLGRLEAYMETHPDHGVAVVQEGQFQLYVAPFIRL